MPAAALWSEMRGLWQVNPVTNQDGQISRRAELDVTKVMYGRAGQSGVQSQS